MGMSTLSVKARLFGTLSLLAVAMIGVGMLGLSQLHGANDRMDEIYNHNFKAAARVDRLLAFQGLLDRLQGQWLGELANSLGTAFALGLGGIFLNVKGREAKGMVEPGADANALAENYADSGISEAQFRTRPEARTGLISLHCPAFRPRHGNCYALNQINGPQWVFAVFSEERCR